MRIEPNTCKKNIFSKLKMKAVGPMSKSWRIDHSHQERLLLEESEKKESEESRLSTWLFNEIEKR